MADHYAKERFHVPPTDPLDAVRLADLDAAIRQIYKAPVRSAASENLDGTYLTGVLTGVTNDFIVTDGVAGTAGDRVLLMGQTDKTQNGIYEITDPGGASPWILTRADDFDDSSDLYDTLKVNVREGTSHHDTTWALVTNDPMFLDTTPLVFEPAGGSVRVAQKTFQVTGDDTTAAFPFTHGWNTKTVTAELIRDSDGATVYADITRAANTVTVTFGAPPATGVTFTLVARAEVS
jgi:hypothetical protein